MPYDHPEGIAIRAHMWSHNKANSWWLLDAKGIELCRVCPQCIEEIRKRYPPEVLGLSGRYEDVVEEQIDEDY